MTIPEESRARIYSALRSLYRYSKLKKMNAPDILIENEILIMDERIDALSDEEYLLAIEAWPRFREEEAKEEAMSDVRWEIEFESIIISTN